MMRTEQRQLVHSEIMLDLSIRTLERDRKHIDSLKSKNALGLKLRLKKPQRKK